jgi:predicted ATPase
MLITSHRLVTLVGIGGIGKSRLGLAVAPDVRPQFPDGVFVAELAPLFDPELVPASVATALGLTLVATAVSHDSVAAAVGGKHLLLVLDNCEHLIEAAAGIAAALLRASPAVSLLATSREPLRVDGEDVYRVPPLAVPAEDNDDAEDVWRHGAVQLFNARARAVEAEYAPEPRLASTIAAVCRDLDGIPLAIELAAARIPAFGVEGLAARLDDRFRLLTDGRRTALPRHQTLRATLDWSYELLSALDRVVLRRLGVFAGTFSLEAAGAVAGGADVSEAAVAESVVTLVAKSLLSATSAPWCAIACSRRRAPTRARSSVPPARPTRSRDATPSTIARWWSAPKPSGRHGPAPNGSPSTRTRSTTSGRRWTGRSPQQVTPPSAWRSPPPRCRYGFASRP